MLCWIRGFVMPIDSQPSKEIQPIRVAGEKPGMAAVVPEPPAQPLTAPPWQRLLRNPRSLAALIMILFMVALALLAPLLAPYSYSFQDRGSELKFPGAGHWMGTD